MNEFHTISIPLSNHSLFSSQQCVSISMLKYDCFPVHSQWLCESSSQIHTTWSGVTCHFLLPNGSFLNTPNYSNEILMCFTLMDESFSLFGGWTVCMKLTGVAPVEGNVTLAFVRYIDNAFYWKVLLEMLHISFCWQESHDTVGCVPHIPRVQVLETRDGGNNAGMSHSQEMEGNCWLVNVYSWG